MYSMSGFGKSFLEFDEIDVQVEIKTVNSRFLDFYIKSPNELNEFENYIKKLIKSRINRGKVEIYISIFYKNESDRIDINYNLLDRYNEIFTDVSKRYKVENVNRVSDFMRIRDCVIIKQDSIEQEKLKEYLESAINEALSNLIEMRLNEGKFLKNDLLEFLKDLENQLNEIEKQYPNILEFHKNNIKDRINDILDSSVEVDKNLLETEIAIYAEKKDISEEIVRMKSHFNQFKIFLNENISVGRKLDFLTQEFNREVNTIASKCVGYEISNITIEMKSIIEKIREQVQNVE